MRLWVKAYRQLANALSSDAAARVFPQLVEETLLQKSDAYYLKYMEIFLNNDSDIYTCTFNARDLLSAVLEIEISLLCNSQT